ncbi:MAG: alkaline phosphatase family protein [Pseudonocardiaceae bacterium]
MELLDILTGNPAVWEKTALIVSYDENGGFFDHVPPPGTPGEYITAPAWPGFCSPRASPSQSGSDSACPLEVGAGVIPPSVGGLGRGRRTGVPAGWVCLCWWAILGLNQ